MIILQLLAILLLTASAVIEKGEVDQRKSSLELSNTEIVQILSDPAKLQYLGEHSMADVNPRTLLVNILEERNVIRSKFKEDIVNREVRMGMNKEEILCILGQPYDWREEWTTPSFDRNSSHFSYRDETLYFKLPDQTRIKVRLRDGISFRFDRF